MLRVQEIAEHLINLINRPGVEGPIAQIGSGQIEPGFAELQAAKLLKLHSVDFNFRLASGVKGQDYDLRVRAVNGANVCVDTKCKLETNLFFESGFYNSLKDAKKRNVPPNLPFGIMVKVPQQWALDSVTMDSVKRQCDRFIDRNGQFVSIIWFSALFEKKDHKMFRRLIYGERFRCKVESSHLKMWDVIGVGTSFNSPVGWRDLSSYFDKSEM